MRNRVHHALLTTTVLGFATLAVPAAAQDTAPGQTTAATPPLGATDDENKADILVTARRRNENIVDVPLAISVVTSAQLEKLNITSTTELANFVPGLEFSNFTPGNSRNDRGGNRIIIFRGLNLAGNLGVAQAASMFLDGAAVIGNEIPAGMDIGAVEVLRGPQNVYFGRSSMTGAISYRTKAIPDHWTYGLDLTIAERMTHRAEASVAGPVLPGLLGVRVTALEESNGGFITNAYDPGGDKLGARSRRSISGTIDFTPAPGLDVKAYANYFHDEDGVSATVNIFPDSPTGTGVVTNCVRGIPVVTPGSPAGTAPLPARPTHCGAAPDISRAVAYSRTLIPTNFAAKLFPVPFLKGEGFDSQAGLQRNVFNSHALVNYDVSDYLKLQSITGYHRSAVIQVIDGLQQPPPGLNNSIVFFGLANKYRDFSQELRLSSNPNKAFSWTVGANYVNAQNLSNATNVTQTNAGVFNPLQFAVSDDRSKTYGFFAGAYLKLFDDRLTASAEGRYQIDKRFNQQIAFVTGVITLPVGAKFKSFNPRFSLDYDVGAGRKVYASLAQGSRPGGFNNGLLSFFDPNNSIYAPGSGRTLAAVTQSISDTFGVIDPTYKEERLRIAEIGFKGNFAHGAGYFDLNTYYGRVTNQLVRQQALVPALGASLSVTTNTGKTEIYGAEFSGNYEFTREISLSTTFAWNHTNRLAYFDPAPANIRLYGITDYSGKELPNAPEYTGSLVLSYDGSAETDGFAPFANAAGVYRGKQWADVANYSYIKGRFTLDLRAGVGNKTLKLEAFVTNATNNKTYPGGNTATDFGSNRLGPDQGFYGAYADPRTFGGRLSARF